MNIKKILSEVLNIVSNEKKKIKSNYGEDKDFVYWTPDGIRMYKIPQKDFLIDLQKALPNKTPINDPHKFFNYGKCELAIKTDEIKVIDKEQVVKIKSEKSHAWVNIKYLKEFESDCTFKIFNSKNPVFVYEYDELVGLVIPVTIKE